jgi:hypothetical protein
MAFVHLSLALLSLPAESMHNIPFEIASSGLTQGFAPRSTKSVLRDPKEATFLEVQSAHTKTGTRRSQNPPEWFDDFEQGESTYTHDGTLADPELNKFIVVRDGWNPHQKNPYQIGTVPSEFFEETPGGGPKNAWQTFYPESPGKEATGKWFRGTGGLWQQEYIGQRQSAGAHLKPAWFDSAVAQNDEFSRMKYPDFKSPRMDIDWEERSVNTTLTCDKPGCIANSSITAPFDPSTELAKDCQISVFFHPTDFENEFEGERVEYVQINDKPFAARCHPYADGCNATATRPLLPCVSSVPLDMVLPENGVLVVSAKISDVVDECPYQGNYLSAVPVVTCMVTSKTKAAAIKAPDKIENGTCTVQAPLQCTQKGCSSKVSIPVSETCASQGTCKLSINVTQTDYDNGDGTPELIQYIKVGETNMTLEEDGSKSGQNPCKSKWSGTNLTQDQLVFSALNDFELENITKNSTVDQRRVIIEAKISKYVDECASDGYLLDAMATIVCG